MADYVLGRFDKDERVLVDEAIKEAADAVCSLMNNGLEATMNIITRRKQK